MSKILAGKVGTGTRQKLYLLSLIAKFFEILEFSVLDFFSDIEEDDLGVLDALLDLSEEQHGLTTIDDSVVVGEGDVHDGSSLDLVTNAHRAVLDGMHAKDG